MKDLIQQCKEELKRTRIMREAAPDYEQKVYAGMISDLQYAVYWLENGYPKGYRRGIHRKSQGLYYDSQFALYVPKENYEDPYEAACDRIDLEREKESKLLCQA